MTDIKHFFPILVFLISFSVFCQNETDETNNKIAGVLNSYFDLEREAIHLHTNKTTFINNESIWYQGYIVNRKTNKPYFTTNLFVLLFDEKGKQLSEKLIYATNGVFSGNIKLDSKLGSGIYYIQVTTNWMNNFNENESTITKVSVINPSEGFKNYTKVNLESLEVFLSPEGKSLVSEISNNIGIQVKDCRGNSPENLEASIQNNNREVLKTIKLNKFGYGKFDIIPTNEDTKVVVNYGGKIIEKTLPKPNLTGISIGVNTFSMENRTAIKIKTNKNSYDLFQSKKLTLVIHQDQKLTLYPIRFKPEELEQTVIVNNADLHEGINTIRIIDNDLKQWSERLIYIPPLFKNNINILKNNSRDGKINLVGYSEIPNSRVSISVLPEDTKSIDENNSIIAGIAINPYLIKPLSNSNYYLNSTNRSKLYELDLVLINQEESKYNWEYMKINAPTSHYSFDIGLSLKGKIDSAIKDKTDHKVKLVAYKDRIMVSTDVSENGDYLFEHLLLTDSSLVKLSLEKLPNFQKVASNLSPKVLNRKWVFNKPITDYIRQTCTDQIPYETMLDLPKFNGQIINLDEVIVKKKASTLTRSNALSNSMLKGYKIDETNNRGSLLNFIEMNGFTVTRNMGDIYITVRQRMSLNAANPSPVVSIDDRVLFSSFNELDLMQMSEVDEIYIDSHKLGNSINNNMGIIKIYTKKPQNNFFSKPDPNSFLVKEAYTPNYRFQNSDYQNTQTKGFENFGLIGWSSGLITDDNGQFIFDITDYNKSKAKIIIHAMTPEGQLFQEERIIELK